jgi:branched-chain amino acid transport system permease protein
MERFAFLTVDGLSRGAVYAAMALALVLIWRGARIVNFAQGAMAVAAAYVGHSVTAATGSFWLGFLAALAGGLALGWLVERLVMRHVGHDRPLNAVIVALGLVLLITAVLGVVYGNEFRPAPPAFDRTAGFALLSPYDVFVFAAVGVTVGALALLFTRTKAGLRLRASAFAPEVSRLLGVNVSGMLLLGWVLAAGVGALAGMLIIPTEFGLHPNAMDRSFVVAFTAAVVGGLDSPAGAVIGGLAVGLVLSFVGGYLGDQVTPLAIIVLLLAVLLIRPDGLFAKQAARRI